MITISDLEIESRQLKGNFIERKLRAPSKPYTLGKGINNKTLYIYSGYPVYDVKLELVLAKDQTLKLLQWFASTVYTDYESLNLLDMEAPYGNKKIYLTNVKVDKVRLASDGLRYDATVEFVEFEPSD